MATKKGVTLTQAIEEFATVASIVAPSLSTFEVWHPSLPEPIYLVDNGEDFVAIKEPTAERDPGASVIYMACRIAIVRPDESDEAMTPEITLSVANVSGIMLQQLRIARGSLAPWELIERTYMSNDPGGPARLPPLELLITGAEMTEDSLTVRARFADPVNVSIPALTFRRSEYPGLVR